MASLILIFSSFAALATYPLIFNLSTHVYGPFFKTDIRGGLWNLWWLKTAWANGWNISWCPYLGAPSGIDLSHDPSAWFLKAALKPLLAVASPVLAFNILTLVSFVGTGIATFALARYLLKDKGAALFTALIFTFSPYHLNKVSEFSFLFLGYWFVLFVWCLLNFFDGMKMRWAIATGCALGIAGGLTAYYGFFALVFLMTALLFYLVKRRPLTFRIAGGLLLMLALAAAINAPFLIQYAKDNAAAAAGTPEFVKNMYQRPISYLFSQSARPLSYLLPAGSHPVFGAFTQKFYGSLFYGRGSIEQTLYLGWVPLFLAFFASRRTPAEKNDVFSIGLFRTAAWVAFFFSLPPLLNLGIIKVYLPSFASYQIVPAFRAYARFGMIVSLCVFVLAGFGLKNLMLRFKTKRSRVFLLLGALGLTLFEFTNLPPWRATDISQVPPVYAWLASVPGDIVVAEYPMAKTSSGEAQENYDYMYYQTVHGKRLVNGALPGTPGYAIRQIITDIGNPQAAPGLKSLGVTYVIFHEDLYKKGVRSKLGILGEAPDIEKMGLYRLNRVFGSDHVYEIL